jgi:spermidine/putrescine transport system ATP-binding protein
VVETPLGRLRGRNAQRLRDGDEAILFVRPERLGLDEAGGENEIGTEIIDVAFEGNFVSLRLAGAAGRDIMMSAVNNGAAMPPPGSRVRVRFAAEDAVVLPKGELARE